MDDFASQNILVTGGTGFIGSHLVKELINLKANVVVTSQSENQRSYFSREKLESKVIKIPTDITDFEKVYHIVTKYDISYIYHFAAQPLVEVAYYNPRKTLQDNICGTINICESARLFKNIKGVVVVSSDKAYGKLVKNKYSEQDELRGDHPYEVSKSAADLIAHSFFVTYQMPIVITRFGNVYGEGDLNFSRLVPGLIKSIISKETFCIRSNGKYIRDYLYVGDVVFGCLQLIKYIKKIKGEAFNLGSEETLSVLDVIKLTEKSLGLKVNYRILNKSKNEIPYQSLDYRKIQKVLGWKQMHTFSEEIKKMYKWYQQII